MDKLEGAFVHNSTVRAYSIEKGYDSCIQCNKLTTCDKDLWNRFPEFHKAVIEMQVKYKEQAV